MQSSHRTSRVLRSGGFRDLVNKTWKKGGCYRGRWDHHDDNMDRFYDFSDYNNRFSWWPPHDIRMGVLVCSSVRVRCIQESGSPAANREAISSAPIARSYVCSPLIFPVKMR